MLGRARSSTVVSLDESSVPESSAVTSTIGSATPGVSAGADVPPVANGLSDPAPAIEVVVVAAWVVVVVAWVVVVVAWVVVAWVVVVVAWVVVVVVVAWVVVVVAWVVVVVVVVGAGPAAV